MFKIKYEILLKITKIIFERADKVLNIFACKKKVIYDITITKKKMIEKILIVFKYNYYKRRNLIIYCIKWNITFSQNF